MSETTDRWALALLHPNQAQKETTHNEALTQIDLLLHAAVEAVGIDTPPATPSIGQAWIIGAAPQGAWSGAAHALAGWTGGGWRFVAPQHGMRVWSRTDAVAATFLDGAWVLGELRGAMLRIGADQVVGPRLAGVAAPAGGAVVDVEARAAIAEILDRLGRHGLVENG